jgi:hypothetical protein
LSLAEAGADEHRVAPEAFAYLRHHTVSSQDLDNVPGHHT